MDSPATERHDRRESDEGENGVCCDETGGHRIPPWSACGVDETTDRHRFFPSTLNGGRATPLPITRQFGRAGRVTFHRAAADRAADAGLAGVGRYGLNQGTIVAKSSCSA